MTKLSVNYRNDPSDGISRDTREYLDEFYFKKLPNINQENPKILVVFACGNAVGKSTLSAKLEQELSALRLENDGVKRVLIAKDPSLQYSEAIHKIVWQYTMDLYRRLPGLTANGLVVRDGIITWYYDRILPIFLEQGYELFIVAYDLSDDKARELINARGDTPTSKRSRLRDLIPDHQIHLRRFLNEYTPDVTLSDDDVFDHEKVIDALKTKIDAV